MSGELIIPTPGAGKNTAPGGNTSGVRVTVPVAVTVPISQANIDAAVAAALAKLNITSGNGVPTMAMAPGALYLRKDGAAGSTFYVKETAAASTVWAAK